MKIALVRARYNPFGGAERFAARALAALAAEKGLENQVTVLARRWSDVEGAAASSVGPVRIVRCDPFYLGSVWRDASFASAVHRQLRTEAFDLVQSHERIVGLPIYRAGDGVHAAWLERRAAAAGPLARLGIALNPHHAYLRRVERAMFEHPALRVVVCNSEMVRRETVARFAIDPAKLVLIRNGVDLDRFHPAAACVHREVVRERLRIPDDTAVFAMVGSGFERKGVGPAVRALRAIGDAVLVIVGDDKHRDRYEVDARRHGVHGRTRFVGAAVDPLPYYAAADFFVAPTLYDPFPNAVLEALACGLPAIVSDACGAAEIIDPGLAGWIVPVGDDAALGEAMRAAVESNVPRRQAMRRAARATAEPYSLAALSSALVALYRSLLGR